MLKMAWKTITTLKWAFRLVYCSMSRFLWRNSWLKYLFSFEEETRVEKALASQLLWNSCSCLTRTWALRKLIQTLACQLSSTLMQFLFSSDGFESWENSHTNSRLPTLIILHSAFVPVYQIEKTLIQTLACQLSTTLIQLLFSFDQDMTVETTLIRTFISQLSITLMQLVFSFDQGVRVEKTLI